MSFNVGDIPFFKEYQFTDTGSIAKHFGLVLLPETATKYQNSLLCCVITSKSPKYEKWSLPLKKSSYRCFNRDSYICFNRKDLVSMNGLDNGLKAMSRLNGTDLEKSYRILKKSLFAIKDLANEPYLRGTIIYEWKRALGLLK